MEKRILAALCAVTCLAAPAFAQMQPVDRRTFYTFSAPVEIPGATLPAGRYLFRFVNPTTGRNVLQVLSDDGKNVQGMFFVIPSERSDIPSKPEIRFMETPAGVPPAIKTVWYPGERSGRELIYPREQAMRLARSTKEPVLTTQAQSTTAEQTGTGDLSRISSSGQDARVNDNASPEAAAPAGAAQQGEIAPGSISVPERNMAPERTMARAENTRTRLPQTASSMPLVALCALCLLGAAGTLRFVRRRSSAL
jgi:hypothetical protein